MAIRFVLSFETAYASLDDAMQRAPDDIRAHLARTSEFHARGVLLEAGAFRAAGPLRTMAIFATREAAEEYAAGDPFVLNGMVTAHSIDEWTDAVRG
jgi:uncharacterized protein